MKSATLNPPLLLATIIGLFALAVSASPRVEAGKRHFIDPSSPEGLRDLFAYSEERLPIVSAHRGGAVEGYPENCIATFERALEASFSILEIDLRLARDDRIVLLHDATLQRTTNGVGNVKDFTLPELKRLRLKDPTGALTPFEIPTLDEAIEWARGKTILILDLKDAPLERCIRKIQQHKAQSFVMIMAYRIEDIQKCHNLDPDIMMEVFLGNLDRFKQFDQSGVPWNRILPFISHKPIEDLELIAMIHAKGASCLAGTTRYLDKALSKVEAPSAELSASYQLLLDQGIDIIETDLPVKVGQLLHRNTSIPSAKAQYFKIR